MDFVRPQLDQVKINEDLTLPFALKDAITRVYNYLGAISVDTGIQIIQDIHANRILYPPGNLTLGSLYYETDRLLTYIVRIVGGAKMWVYFSGVYPRTQAQLAGLAATLTSRDNNLLVDVTDYAHILKWTGAAWTYNDPTDPAGRIEGWLVDPDPVTGWHLCDGALVNYLKKDGTTAAVTLPDLTSAANKAAYLKFGSPASATVTPAVAPTLVMNSYTPAGTVTAPSLTMNSYTPAGTISAPLLTMNSYTPAGTFTGGAADATTAVSAGTVAAHTGASLNLGAGVIAVELFANIADLSHAPLGTHSHTVSPTGTIAGTPATLTGTVSTPTFTGTPATLTGTNSVPVFSGTPAVLTGTISATGEPQQVELRPYFRL